MRTPDLGKVVELLLRENASDTDLLNRYVLERDELAFAAIVRRHGPMVWSVCNRVLRNVHDAEDAFQAAFLLLVRKAKSIGKPELLANWLHGVAYRTALRAKQLRHRRREREAEAGSRTERRTGNGTELREVLDRELAHLSEEFRSVVILCDLEGRTRKEVAQRLGLAEGTVASRLSRGRARLARRLARYGLPIGVVLAFLVEPSFAAVPKALVDSTVKAAALFAAGTLASTEAVMLMQGVFQAMYMTKLKLAAAVLLMTGILVTTLGAKVLSDRTHGLEPQLADANVEPQKAGPQEKPQAVEPKTDLQKMQGTWKCIAIDVPRFPAGGGRAGQDAGGRGKGGQGGGGRGGNPFLPPMSISQFQRVWMVIKDHTMTPAWGNGTTLAFRLDESKKPKTIDVQVPEKDQPPLPGIYSLDGDELTLGFGPEQRPLGFGPERPTEFGTAGNPTFRFRRAEEPKTVLLHDLLGMANAARFDDEYRDQRFRVAGTVASVKRVESQSDGDHYLVRIQEWRKTGADTYLYDGDFRFGLESKKQLAGLEEGQKVILEGQCSGRGTTTGMKDRKLDLVRFDMSRIISAEK